MGCAAHLDDELLHQLKLAALLHDIGLLMLPPHLHTEREARDPDSYVAIQNHPRLGANLLEPFSFLSDATIMIATIMSDGMDRVIPMVLEESLFRWVPEFLPSPTHSRLFRFPMFATDLCAIVSRSESCAWPQELNLIPLSLISWLN